MNSDLCIPEKEAVSSPDTQAPPASIGPFNGLKSEDEEEEEELAVADRQEEEELAVADRQEEEEEDEELDEAELEAFLDGQLADRLPFLQQEGSRQGIAIENQEQDEFGAPPSKAEDALRTCEFHVKGPVHPVGIWRSR